MFQLKFDNDFNTIIRDIPYWKKEEDIPDNIKKFVIDTSNMRVIYEESTKKFYCGKCLEELDNNYYCKKCDIQHKNFSSKEITASNATIKFIDKLTFSKIKDLDAIYDYFMFDIVGKNVILYRIQEDVTYYNPFITIPYKSIHLNIDISTSYYIEKDGLTNLETNEFIYFKTLAESYDKLEYEEIEEKEFEQFEKIYLIPYCAYFYTDNLNLLKDTIYQYSRIWELNDYLKEAKVFNICQFTLYPLFYASFEYLVNYKLYNLAWEIPNWFNKGNNFKEIFGLDKKYLPFMSENNISFEEFEILQIYPTTDIEVLRFFNNLHLNIEILKSTNADLLGIKKYLESNNLSSCFVYEYFDYINMAKELKLDLKNKKILYPTNLREAHDELYDQIEIINDPIIDKKIKSLSTILSLNKYEDDNYIIYPAPSIQDLVEESKQQKNCVRTYCERVANNKSQIYFMRKKTELEKSLVTIEVYGNKIIQARVKYNKLPSEELMNILNKWEQTLIPIINN